MDIALAKRRENIAEYILYLWQIEDLLRALQFSPEAIYSQLIAPRGIEEGQRHNYLLWYMDIANLLREEGKEEKGHLEHTLHLIGDLNDLHLQLMKLPIGEHYRQTFAKLEPELPRLRAVLGREMSDIELCFRQGRTGRGGPLQRHGTGTVTDRKTRDESGLCGVAPETKKKKNLRYFWQIKKKIIHLHSALYAKTIKTR